jgi:nicotinamidase-related amidase
MAGKTILLIIDPQVDFTTGTLKVEGAKEDYDRIIKFIDDVNFDEIHVSLDTHNEDHIGHPSFWKKKDTIKGENIHPDPFQVLSIKDDIIKAGKTIVEPVDGDIEYAKQYVSELQDKYNKTKLLPMIWNYHCMVPTKGQEVNIEDKKGFGHAVASPLKETLESQQIRDKVKYHIKGQNNLTEMYSIFGAEYESDKALKIQGSQPNVEGHPNYNEAKDATNQYVERNKKLMERLLNGGNNTVYVCGQARTHCVKESLKHLLEYADEMGYDTTKIRLLYNMSSPISRENGGVDDIHTIPKVTLVKTDKVDLELARIRTKREEAKLNEAKNRLKNSEGKFNKLLTNRQQQRGQQQQQQQQAGKRRRRKTKKRHNKKPKRKVTKKRHHKKTKKRKVRKTKKNKTRKR